MFVLLPYKSKKVEKEAKATSIHQFPNNMSMVIFQMLSLKTDPAEFRTHPIFSWLSLLSTGMKNIRSRVRAHEC